MTDDNQSRDGEMDDEERRQPEREVEEVRDRATEYQQKHSDPSEQFGDLDVALEA